MIRRERHALRRVKQKISASMIAVLAASRQRAAPCPVRHRVAMEGEIDPDIEALIGTNTGLCRLADGKVTRILDGRTYGIALTGDRWFAVVNQQLGIGKKPLGIVGRLVSFRLVDGEIVDLQVKLPKLSPAIHQAEMWGDSLLLADTPHNRIIEARWEHGRVVGTACHYPNGRLYRGRESDNYVHLNSFFSTEDRLFVLFHNDSARTARKSAIVELDSHYQMLRQTEIPASCAHNLRLENDRWFFLDSRGGAMMASDELFYKADCFLRGMARLPGGWLIGGSDFSPLRERRRSTGYLFHLDEGGRVLGKLRLPEIGSVYEARMVC